METLTLALPYPPSGTNNLYMTVGRRRVKTAAARAYAEEAGWIARKALQEAPCDGETRFTVSIFIYPKRGLGIDVDNTKLILDSLTGIVWKDDKQVWKQITERRKNIAGGRIVVSIEEYDTD